VAASREVTGARFPTRPARHPPHLSLAYGVAPSRDEPLSHRLATHPTGTMTFTAAELTLVAQSHDGVRAITWRPGHRPSHRPRLTGNDAAQFWLCGWLGQASR
jgi:hypothetical protein